MEVEGGRRRECEGGCLQLGERMVAKVHEQKVLDRRRCRSRALEQDSEGQSIELWRDILLCDGDRVC